MERRTAMIVGAGTGGLSTAIALRQAGWIVWLFAALRLGRYFGNSPRFWLDLQSQYDLASLERERGREIASQVHPAGAAI